MANDWSYDRALDLSGLKCPLPVLKARKALLAMKRGERLMVTATDPLSTIDMAHFTAESANPLIATAAVGERLMFLIEKGSGAAPR